MRPRLTVCFITSRAEPEFEWFLDSLALQTKDSTNVIVVDEWQSIRYGFRTLPLLNITRTRPKPTVWSGQHRLTKADWWSKSNSINTAICLCDTEFIAFIDDRSVLMPTWMEGVQAAMAGRYAACGPYQKRHSITVENGVIRNAGIVTGDDNRKQYVREHWSDPRHQLTNPYKCPGSWWYGCSTVLPMEWALAINGADETCDSSSGEDYIMGRMLENNGYDIRYDLRMEIVEDRTAGKLGPEMIRRDKGVSPNDKSHALLDRLGGQKRSQHQWDIPQIRAAVRRGLTFPVPMEPTRDWYDGEKLSDMEPG